MAGLTLVTAPTVEPVLLPAAMLALRIETTTEAALIESLITAAREYVEAFTRRALVSQTWDLQLDGFPSCDWLEIPTPPLRSVTSVTYVDGTGTTQTLSSALYAVDAPAGPWARHGRINLNYGETWPATRSQPNAVTVRFVAGYGTEGDSVPEALKTGIKMLVGHWFEQREAAVIGVGIGVLQVPLNLDALLWPYRSY
jgi:uncharacterized phiE125 gp8 family phage protein